MTACARCLRRAWLLAALAPNLEQIRHERTGGAAGGRGCATSSPSTTAR